MHDHNDNNNGMFSSMMWMMVICCLGPIVIAFLAGRSAGGLSKWWLLGIIVFCLGIHLFMGRRKKQPAEKMALQQIEAERKSDENNPEV